VHFGDGWLSQRLAAVLAAALLGAPAQGLASQSAPGIRLISVGTEAQALLLRSRILSGESFDRLAREESDDPSAPRGGYLGRLSPADLRPDFRDALEGAEPGSVTPPVPSDGRYYLLGVLTEAEESWIAADAAGRLALAEGRHAEGERFLESAIAGAELFGTDDLRLAESLAALADLHQTRGNTSGARELYLRLLPMLGTSADRDPVRTGRLLTQLAETYRLDGEPASAEPHYRRALELLEGALGPAHLDVASALGNLALARKALGDYAEAERLARASLEVVETILGADHAAMATGLGHLADILDAREAYTEAEGALRGSLAILERTLAPTDTRIGDLRVRLAGLVAAQGRSEEAVALCWQAIALLWGPAGPPADVLRETIAAFTDAILSHSFQDAPYRDALVRLEAALEGTPPPPDMALALVGLMLDSGLTEAADSLLARATEWHPRSGQIRIRLAERHAEAGRVEDALEAFTAARMVSALEPDFSARRAQLAYVDGARADLLTGEGRFDEALEAYEAALEAEPGRAETLLALGVLQFRRNEPASALEAYRRALELDPRDRTAHFRIAQVELARNRFQEALDSADRALAIEPAHAESRFVRARALIRLDREAEGREALDLYLQLETSREADESRRMEAFTLVDAAAAHLRDENYPISVDLYRDAILRRPDVPDFHLDLGAVLGRLDRHEEAAETLRRMLELGFGDFRVHRSLARENAALGRPGEAIQHEVEYLRALYAALREEMR
jgi:tetratricopeptide (TPR) repeat protein